MIFVDTNVISETLRKTPDAAVMAWLARNDAELALPTVAIAEIAFGIKRYDLMSTPTAWSKVSLNGAIALPTVFLG